MGSIPVADISAFIGDRDNGARKAAAGQLAEAVRVHGCAAIKGHGLSEGELQDAFANVHKLFDLPIEEKMKAPHPEGPRPHRGYLATAVERSGKLGVVHSKSEHEKLVLSEAVDWKETYDIGHEKNVEQKNIWLPDDVFPGFRTYMVELHERISLISLAILEGLMLGMGLTEEDCEALRRLHTPVTHQMRLAHYLPMTPDDRKDTNKIWLAPHRDFAYGHRSPVESGSGLEFQNRETEEYMPADPREGILYLNIGDLMTRYSNGFYPSAMHRVMIPSIKDADGTVPGRYSIPFFTHVGLTESIYPMPSRVAADGKSNYDNTDFPTLAARLFNPAIKV